MALARESSTHRTGRQTAAPLPVIDAYSWASPHRLASAWPGLSCSPVHPSHRYDMLRGERSHGGGIGVRDPGERAALGGDGVGVDPFSLTP